MTSRTGSQAESQSRACFLRKMQTVYRCRGEEAERGMIRVVNLDMMKGFWGVCERVVRLCRISSFSLVASGCTGEYGDLEGRVRCVFMGDVTWNRVGCFDNKNQIYRWIQSPRSIFLWLPQWSMADFKKQRDIAL